LGQLLSETVSSGTGTTSFRKGKESENLERTFHGKMAVNADGPCGGLVATRRIDAPGQEKEIANYITKMASEVSQLCSKTEAFNFVILFSGIAFIAFQTIPGSAYKLLTPRKDIIDRGAKASPKYLDWQTNITSVVERPLLG